LQSELGILHGIWGVSDALFDVHISEDEFCDYCTQIAIWWAADRYPIVKNELPSGFGVPDLYKADDYYYRSHVLNMVSRSGKNLDDDCINVAMFLARGLYYMTSSLQDPFLSYLPNSYRSVLLGYPELAAFTAAPLETGPFPKIVNNISDTDVLNQIGKTMLKYVQDSRNTSIIDDRSVIGGAFMASFPENPKDALDAALRFRVSHKGERTKSFVRELLELASKGKKLSIDARLKQLQKT
jgi:hypothetical protein